MFNARVSTIQTIVTLVSVAFFLPLYYLSYYYRGKYSLLVALAQIILCLAVLPFNFGANTYLVYGVISAAFVASANISVWFLVLSLAAMFAETVYLSFPLVYSISTAVMASVLVFYTLYGRQVERSNLHLKLSQQEVQRLAQSNERERIARDLHDMLGHTLSLIVMKSELASRLYAHDSTAAIAHIQDVEKIARESLGQIRSAVSGIRLAKLEAELANARLSLLSADIHLHYQLAPIKLAAEIESVFAMAVREAITNIIRYAEAKRVEVELTQQGKQLQLQISDDGKGNAVIPGNGLKGMEERLHDINGTLLIDKSASGGVRLTLRCAFIEQP
jgi:two-component system sensor histidine kinase DesK